jgi:hypothetical protein
MNEPMPHPSLQSELASQPQPSAAPHAIVFVEADVPDYQSLLAGIAPGTEVHVLDAGVDGLARMAQVLEGRSDIDALHIISHGREGTVSLGSLQLSSGNMAARADDLEIIRAALNPGADILLYGCDVGAGTNGAAFVESLAQVTGADVAASSDSTGAASLGGNWALEMASGDVEATPLLGAATAAGYAGLLATFPSGVQTFAGFNNATHTTQDGFFRVTGSDGTDHNWGIVADEFGAYFDQGNGLAGGTVYMSYIEVALVASGSFKLTGISAGDFDASADNSNEFTNIYVEGRANGGTVFTTPGVASPSYDAQYGIVLGDNANKLIDSFRIYFTGDNDDQPTGFNFQSFSINGGSTAPVTDNTAPVTPGSLDLAAGSDSGIYNDDNKTSATNLSFSGTSATGDTSSTVRVFLDKNGNGVYDAGTDASNTATVNNGSWSVGGIDVSGVSDGTYKVYAQITSASGGLTSARSNGLDVTLDRTAPTLTIESSSPTLKAGQTATITFRFSEDPGSTFIWDGTQGGVVVSGGTLGAITGSGLTRQATFTPNAGVNSDTASITVASGSYTDAAGNNGGAGSTPSLTFDTRAPAVSSIVRASANNTNATSVSYTVTFDDSVAGVDKTDFLLTPTGTAAGTIASVSGSGTTYTVTINGISGDGTLRLDLKSSGTGITDANGNTVAGYTSGEPYTFDHTAPAVSSVAVPASATYRVGQSLDFTVNFNETVTVDTTNGTPSIAVTLDTGGTVQAAYVSGTGSSALTFRYVVSTGNADNNGVTLGSISLNSGTIRDVAGNNAALTLNSIGSTAGVLVSALAPSVTSIVRAGDALTNATSVQYTVAFSDSVTGVDASDFTLAGTGVSGNIAAISGSGNSYTVNIDNISGEGTLRLDLNAGGTGIVNGSGQDITGGYTSGQAYTIDRTAPALANSISISDTALKIGDSATVTFTFTEAVTGFTATDVTVPNGTLLNLHSSDGGRTWTATLTSAAGTSSATNVLTLNYAGITDLAGNAGIGSAESANYAVDTVRPSLESSIAISDAALKIGDSATVTFTFNEAITGFDIQDVTVSNGTLKDLATLDGGRTWTATLTPNDFASADANVLKLNYSGIADLAGNAGIGTVDSGNYRVDTIRPSLAAPIIISDSSLKAGETATVTFQFTEAVAGFDIADVTVPNGTLSDLKSVNGGTVWTATLTPAVGVSSSANVLTVNYSGINDLAGNAGEGTAKSGNYEVDTKVPVLALPIEISDSQLKIGDSATVTFTFTEAVTGFTVDDVAVPHGTLADLGTSDGGITWTATLTPAAGASSANNVLTLNYSGIANLAGNAGVGSADSGNYQVDTVRPSLASSITISDTSLKAGETATVTFTFTEAISGFDINHVTVQHGTLTNLTSANGGTVWTATLTPAAGTSSLANVLTLDYTGIADLAGNAGVGSINSGNYQVDTVRPSLASSITISDTSLKAGETATVTFTFTEAITGFDINDVTVPHGTLSNLSSQDGITWTATLTPNSNVASGTNELTLNYSGIANLAGNAGTGSVSSPSYAIDTVPVPSEPSVPPVSSTVDGTPVTVTTRPADPVTGIVNTVLTVPVITATRPENPNTPNNNLADIPLGLGTENGPRTELLVSLPTGTGLQAEGPSTLLNNSQALLDLIRRIENKTETGSNVQTDMKGNGTSFLGGLPPDTMLQSKTLVLTGQEGSTTPQTILISGSSTTPVEGSPNPTAIGLVIDASALPSGSLLQLDNVDFAAVVGAATLRGGNGKNYVVGDGASQNILLGADDDILHGGGGDDIIGSAGGNDQIFGDEGNDLVFGGEGNDAIDGGTGIDTVRLVGSGRADYMMRVENGKLTITHRNGGIDGTDTVGNVEKLNFTGVGPDMTVGGIISRMYDATFDRAPDQQGLSHWKSMSQSGTSMHDIANQFINSQEAQALFGAQSNAQFVDGLYQQSLGREADAAGRTYWLGLLDQGKADRAEVMFAFANSAEKLAQEKANGYTLDFAHTDVATFVRMYDTLFDRKADTGGLNHWIAASENGMALRDIANSFIHGEEAVLKFSAMSNTQFVEYLYKAGLDRQGRAEEVAAWASQLDSGAIGRADALLGFADSTEKIALVGVMSTSIETI